MPENDWKIVPPLPAARSFTGNRELPTGRCQLPRPANNVPTGERRKASPLLRGTVVLRDELITPPIPEEDWDALK